MNTPVSDISIRLPEWLTTFMAEDNGMYADNTSRMQLVINLARQNIDQNTGDSFGEAIFGMGDHTLLAAGVNLVAPSSCSMTDHNRMDGSTWSVALF